MSYALQEQQRSQEEEVIAGKVIESTSKRVHRARLYLVVPIGKTDARVVELCR